MSGDGTTQHRHAAASVERVFEGPVFAVDVARWIDETGRPVRRDLVRHPGAVLIVPVVDDETFLMIRNYRAAPDETLWEFPAGKLEVGEDPRAAAGRGLEEETGYRAAALVELGRFYTSPGFADELMHVFLATELEAVGQRLEPGEAITLHEVKVEQAMTLAASGELRDGKTLAALLLWGGGIGRRRLS